jgi:hypothetical protein
MKNLASPVIPFLAVVGLALFACNEPHATSGSTDGTNEDAYELNSEDNLAAPMDSVAPMPSGDTLK